MHLRSGYPLYCPEAISRMYYYPSPYVTPMLKYDGLNGGSAYGGWNGLVTGRFGVTSQVTATMYGDYSDGTGTINVRFRNDTTVTITARAYIVITEDSLYYLGPNGDPWHNHVARDYVPNQVGQYVTIPAGDSVTVTQPFTIQTGWDEDMCEIVAWLQTDGTRKMWQGAKVPVTAIPGVEENTSEIEAIYTVTSKPNPCVNHTSFQFELPINTGYRIDIYDVTGRHIKRLNGIASGNNESVTWNLKDNTGSHISAGVYCYRFFSEFVNTTGKIIVQ
jgi:hypothetical protein